MQIPRIQAKTIFAAIMAMSLLAGVNAGAQNRPAKSAPAAAPAAGATAPRDEDVEATRDQLFQLLRVTPRLTSVVARDPSLLADQPYVERTNPELAQFLQQHPEVARNPEFYLFARLNGGRESREQSLEQTVWPEYQSRQQQWPAEDVFPFLAFIVIVIALMWLLRVSLENRRWTRVQKTQTDVYNKLLEKFGTSEELLQYMRTDPGKRFFESAPVAMEYEPATHSLPVTRIMKPLQLGIVLALSGVGLMALRAFPEVAQVAPTAMVLGILGMSAGAGFIISAIVSWAVAHRYGLMPRPAADHGFEATRAASVDGRAPLA